MTHVLSPTEPQLSPAALQEICSLTPEALSERLAMIRREIEPFATATQMRGPDGGDYIGTFRRFRVWVVWYGSLLV